MTTVTFNRPEPVVPPIESVTFTVSVATAKQLAWLAGNSSGITSEGDYIYSAMADEFGTLPMFDRDKYVMQGAILIPGELRG